MRCGDLERFLEAFLDGRLGRSRTAVLRRHLALCGVCQVKVERLRQFERDTQDRFRAPEQPGSVWAGLELNLVGSHGAVGGGRLLTALRGLPSVPGNEAAPERPGPRRAAARPQAAVRVSGRGNASRLVGALLVTMALGAAYQLVRGELVADAESSAARAYLAYRRDQAVPALSSGDARQVADWLSAELGRSVPLPPLPEGYHLVGASQTDLNGGVAGALIYAQVLDPEAAPVMLFIHSGTAAGTDSAELPGAADAVGLQQVDWTVDSLSYTAVGPVPADQLRRFQH